MQQLLLRILYGFNLFFHHVNVLLDLELALAAVIVHVPNFAKYGSFLPPLHANVDLTTTCPGADPNLMQHLGPCLVTAYSLETKLHWHWTHTQLRRHF